MTFATEPPADVYDKHIDVFDGQGRKVAMTGLAGIRRRLVLYIVIAREIFCLNSRGPSLTSKPIARLALKFIPSSSPKVYSCQVLMRIN